LQQGQRLEGAAGAAHDVGIDGTALAQLGGLGHAAENVAPCCSATLLSKACDAPAGCDMIESDSVGTALPPPGCAPSFFDSTNVFNVSIKASNLASVVAAACAGAVAGAVAAACAGAGAVAGAVAAACAGAGAVAAGAGVTSANPSYMVRAVNNGHCTYTIAAKQTTKAIQTSVGILRILTLAHDKK
jgi:hypothetical protein